MHSHKVSICLIYRSRKVYGAGKKDEGGVNLSQSDVINANNTIASVMGNKFARLYAWAVRHERMTGRKTHASWHV